LPNCTEIALFLKLDELLNKIYLHTFILQQLNGSKSYIAFYFMLLVTFDNVQTIDALFIAFPWTLHYRLFSTWPFYH